MNLPGPSSVSFFHVIRQIVTAEVSSQPSAVASGIDTSQVETGTLASAFASHSRPLL